MYEWFIHNPQLLPGGLFRDYALVVVGRRFARQFPRHGPGDVHASTTGDALFPKSSWWLQLQALGLKL